MNNLKQLREKSKITQTELAYKAGVSQRYIAFLETGERTPSLDVAYKIAHVLGHSVEKIFLPKNCTKSTTTI